ncbi:MAG: 2-hydroxyacyl-CoA dehydratase [bacterium]|nr:2-hydroxyacyl-CoA dehydratase [bacterium]
MKNVLYTCPFVPDEWIEAHQLTPARLTPEPTDKGMTAGVCPFAAAFILAASTTPAAGIIATTVCDQMRRSPEIIESQCDTPIFLMNVPATSAMELYRDELTRLGRFLTTLGGIAPTKAKLADTMRRCDANRARLRTDSENPRQKGVPLILAGGPLRSTDAEIFDLVAQAGGTIVLNATSGGEMTRPAPFDQDRLESDPAGELASAYFGHIPHAMRRPNNQLYEYLARQTAATGARGVIYRHYQWCDTWHGEVGRLKDTLPIPVLHLVAGDDESDRLHVLTRIQAFVEMLK